MKRRYHLRLPFWIYCGITLLVALAAVNTSYNLLFWIFGVLAAALLISGLISGWMMIGLRVRRVIGAHGVVGEPLIVRYEVTNRNRFLPAFNIHFEERPLERPGGWQRVMSSAYAWVMHIGPRETVHGDAIFLPHQRGPAHFQRLRFWTTFPFGIIGKSVTCSQPQHTLVYPRIYPLRHGVLEAVAPAGPLGSEITQHSGAGDDFYGLRDFRPGDSMRHIAWKRTANRDQLVCIERTKPNPPRLRIALNLTRSTQQIAESAGDPDTARQLEETAISLAASIIHAAELARYEIGLTVLGVDRPPIPVRRSHWHRNRLMAALAEIDLDQPRLPSRLRMTMEAERAAVVVIHPDRPDLSLASDEIWHFSAGQADHLIIRSEEQMQARAPHTPVEVAA